MRKVLVLLFVAALSTAALGQASGAPAAKPATPSSNAPAQPPAKVTVAQVMDRQLTNLENDLVPLVEAMPEDKFGFAPTQGEFKGVRTFAAQAKHIAHTNFLIFAPLLGEKLPANVDPKEDNGPDSMTSKADIVKYVKDSFAMGHRAMNTLTEANLTERITPNPFGGNGPGPTKLGASSLTIWHSFDHYGQMVEYLRMNGLVPPASRQQQ